MQFFFLKKKSNHSNSVPLYLTYLIISELIPSQCGVKHAEEKGGRRGIHSSETKGLCLMELSSEIFKTLLHFNYMNPFKIRKMKSLWVIKKYVAKLEAFA